MPLSLEPVEGGGHPSRRDHAVARQFGGRELERLARPAERGEHAEVVLVEAVLTQHALLVALELLQEQRGEADDAPGDVLGRGVEVGTLDPPLVDDRIDRIAEAIYLAAKYLDS